jgi:hypothetical protein
MFVLLQVYPFDAVDLDNECCCLDIMAVDASKAQLEQYLVAYERWYRTAVAVFDAWDDMSKDWGEEHDRKHEELQDWYQVYGSLIWETRFKIVEVEASHRPVAASCSPPPMAQPLSARLLSLAPRSNMLAWLVRRL